MISLSNVLTQAEPSSTDGLLRTCANVRLQTIDPDNEVSRNLWAVWSARMHIVQFQVNTRSLTLLKPGRN